MKYIPFVDMNTYQQTTALRAVEHRLRESEQMLRELFPNFNSIPNVERFIISTLKANEALRQIQRGNFETVEKYWGDHNE